jgi:hypothetical protein
MVHYTLSKRELYCMKMQHVDKTERWKLVRCLLPAINKR